jgi:hypothetical protein
LQSQRRTKSICNEDHLSNMLMSILSIVVVILASTMFIGSESFSLTPAPTSRSRLLMALTVTRSPFDIDISALYSENDFEDEYDMVTSSYSYLSGLNRPSAPNDNNNNNNNSHHSSSSWSTSLPSSSMSTISYSSIASYCDDSNNDEPSNAANDESMFFAPSNSNNIKSHKVMKEPMMLMDMFYATGTKVESDNTFFQ